MRMPDAPIVEAHLIAPPETVRCWRNGYSERGSGSCQCDLCGDRKSPAEPAVAHLTGCHLTVARDIRPVGQIHVPQVSHSIP
jgi:hypothetical protein